MRCACDSVSEQYIQYQTVHTVPNSTYSTKQHIQYQTVHTVPNSWTAATGFAASGYYANQSAGRLAHITLTNVTKNVFNQPVWIRRGCYCIYWYRLLVVKDVEQCNWWNVTFWNKLANDLYPTVDILVGVRLRSAHHRRMEDPLTISMIRVFFPARFFLATIYCARTTPPKRTHTLALAAAPTFTTAVLSMATPLLPSQRVVSSSQHGPSLSELVEMCAYNTTLPLPS